MSLTGCLIIEGADEWTIVVGDQVERLASDVELSELPICANLMIGLAGIKNPPIVFAPASTSCFFCIFPAATGVDLRDRQALLYELENHLPMDAESTVADFAILPDTNDPRISAVAIDASRWQTIVDAFESADLQVQSIVPAAVLATRGVAEQIESTETAELFLVDGDYADIIAVRNDTILSWKHLAIDPKVIGRHRKLDQNVYDRTIVAGLDQGNVAVVQSDQVQRSTKDREALAIYGGQMLLDRQSSQWFDLRRDALAPSDPLRAIGRQLRWVAVAAAACMLALAIGGWWRSNRIETEIGELRTQQTDLFKAAFPGSRVPVAMMRRIRNEHSQVLGSRGQNSDVAVPTSAPLVLRTFLGALPTRMRYRITRIEIRDGEVTAMLQVQTVEDAGVIASAIDKAGFDVAPPGTRQVDPETIESELRATWQSTTAAGTSG